MIYEVLQVVNSPLGSLMVLFLATYFAIFQSIKKITQERNECLHNLKDLLEPFIYERDLLWHPLPDTVKDELKPEKKKINDDTTIEIPELWLDNDGYKYFFNSFWELLKSAWRIAAIESPFLYHENPYPSNPTSHINSILIEVNRNKVDNTDAEKQAMRFLLNFTEPSYHDSLRNNFNGYIRHGTIIKQLRRINYFLLVGFVLSFLGFGLLFGCFIIERKSLFPQSGQTTVLNSSVKMNQLMDAISDTNKSLQVAIDSTEKLKHEILNSNHQLGQISSKVSVLNSKLETLLKNKKGTIVSPEKGHTENGLKRD
jgi:hypothetical protein